ncbi:MAG TPA: phosphoribosyltransferase family protein [Oligoflexia bacterium]|nr:phosphoribosyltransferase family protein [Oligoflexia bacterium]
MRPFYVKLSQFSSKITVFYEKYFLHSLQYLIPFHCIFCKKPIVYQQDHLMLCKLCNLSYHQPSYQIGLLKKPSQYFYHINLFIYDHLCRQSLIRAKFKHAYPDINVFITAAKHYLIQNLSYSADIENHIYICHVPGVKQRLKKRKFDLLHYASQQLANHLDLTFKPNLIIRIKKTVAQKKLSLAQRQKNIQGAFKVTQNLNNKHILLIDDIYTSGSTVSYISQLLINAKAKNVYVLSFAIKP